MNASRLVEGPRYDSRASLHLSSSDDCSGLKYARPSKRQQRSQTPNKVTVEDLIQPNLSVATFYGAAKPTAERY